MSPMIAPLSRGCAKRRKRRFLIPFPPCLPGRRPIEMENMFGVIHTDGSGEDNPPVESLSALYDELKDAGREHGDVSVIHDESHYCMSAHRNGRIVFERLGTRGREARHIAGVSKDRVLALWSQLIVGDIEGILSEPWESGY